MEARDLFLSEQLDPDEVARFLSGFGFKDPERADRHLQNITLLLASPERIADIAPRLLEEVADAVDPDAALLHLETFFENSPGPLNLLSLFESAPDVLSILIRILGASPFLTQLLLRNPEYFYWLLEQDRLNRVYEFDYFADQADRMTKPFDDTQLALNALRRMRRRETLRIGAQDLLSAVSTRDTVRQISFLADAVLQKCFERLAAGRLQEGKGFAVLALGKLGGLELNFSSDVDLLFIYEDDTDARLMLRFAKDYLKNLSEFTEEGHLYRVDLRLRPLGKSGEIAYSEKAAQQYYQTWADTTDRLALIKCRAAAGDLELGQRFCLSIQDFVFKKYLDQAAVEEIRWIKKRTDESLRRQRDSTNVKLGLGGIREIEFFAQSFQILYAGTNPDLRTPNTLTALQKLVDGGFITMVEFERLNGAYAFLRNLEHKLQLVHDLQTHSLPNTEEELMLCAKRMGYRELERLSSSALEQFQIDLRSHNQSVREIFDSLFEVKSESRGIEQVVLDSNLSDEDAAQRLGAHGVSSPEDVIEGIRILQGAPAFPHSPSRIRNLLANLVPHLIEGSQQMANPRDLFSRFDRFCEALGSRANLYQEVIGNPEFTRRLLGVLASGEVLSETLIQNPELLDSVTRPQTPGAYLPALTRFTAHGRKSGRTPADSLRHFKRREEFKIALHELENPGHAENRVLLTNLAEACLSQACDEALSEHSEMDSVPFLILGLGKLGGRELALHSDLDLIFLYDDRADSVPTNALLPLLKSFRDHLQKYTDAGRAYEIDFRLRPEGRHATEIVPVSQLESYFRERLEPWERLAYVKARPVVCHNMDFEIGAFVFERRFTETEIARLRHVRMRKEKEIGRESKLNAFDLKVGRGALLDVQFIVQFLQVQHKILEPNTLQAITLLSSSDRVQPSESQTLEKALKFFFALESLMDLSESREPNKLARGLQTDVRLAALMGFAEYDQLIEAYSGITEAVRRIFFTIFGQD